MLGTVVSDTFEQLANMDSARMKGIDKHRWLKEGVPSEIIKQGLGIVRGYRWHYKKSLLQEVPGTTELKRVFDIDDLNISLVVKIDTILQDARDGGLWITERKTTRRMPSAPLPTWFLQAGLYYLGLILVGEVYEPEEIEGVIFDKISTSQRKVPQQLKNGELSQAKGGRVEGNVFVHQLKKLGLDRTDYTDYLDFLRRDSHFYHRFSMKYHPDELGYIWNWLKQVVTAIRADEVFLPAWSYDCAFCDCFPLCEAERSGLDVNIIIDSSFRRPE